MTLASDPRVSKSLRVMAAVAMGMTLAATASAQARFEATEATAIAGLPELRILSIRDTLRNRCYLAFVANPSGADVIPAEPSDVAAAAAQRDRDLSDLVHTYENDTSVYAGTITPNPLKYETLAATAQINFALTVIQSLLARLEAQLDRATAAKSALAIVPDACAADAHAPPQ
jgi:hypothetical protein